MIQVKKRLHCIGCDRMRQRLVSASACWGRRRHDAVTKRF